jgi:beta-lactamase regulating signal transducer with metallopeptidase domain
MTMMFSAFWNEALTAALVNHLWQSTVVVLIAWLLTVILRGNQARTRYWVWMIASVKFLIPFSLLISTGESLRMTMATPIPRPALAAVMEQIAQPFPHTGTLAHGCRQRRE